MKSLIVKEPNIISIEEVQISKLADDQVLIKIEYCGICGTDLAIYTGNCSFVKDGLIKYPARIGHEWSGVIAEIGLNVTSLKVGDRVVGDNFVPCEQCEYCHNLDYGNCINKFCVGTINCWDGGFADYIIMPEKHVYRLADGISLKNASLIEPISIAYSAIKKMNITKDSTVVVIGTGCIGMSAATLAKYKGANKVFLVGRNHKKLEIANKLGLTATICVKDFDIKEKVLELTGGKGADYIIECSGAPSEVMRAVEIAAHKATIALVGFYEDKLNDINIDLIVLKEITIIGTIGEYGDIETVAKIMAEYDLGLEVVITSIIDFKDCVETFVNQANVPNNSIKTLIKMSV